MIYNYYNLEESVPKDEFVYPPDDGYVRSEL